MKKIEIKIPAKSILCPHHMGGGLIDRAGEFLQELNPPPSGIFIISNRKVMDLYGQRLIQGLSSANITEENIHTILMGDGESHKNSDELFRIISTAVEMGLERNSLIIPLGGGVTGDLGGFSASIALRGVRYIHIPTSLIAQVDSSIGGKVGINIPQGKNLTGSFYFPQAVITDPELLRTLDGEQFSSGMAEVVKTAITGSPLLLERLMRIPGDISRISAEDLEDMVFQSALIKIELVQADPMEKNQRMKLNLGHTLGHALEAMGGFSRYPHGFAVAIGTMFALRLSDSMGILKDRPLIGIAGKLFERFGLPTEIPRYPADEIIRYMWRDKKRAERHINFALPVGRGNVTVVKIEGVEKIIEILEGDGEN